MIFKGKEDWKGWCLKCTFSNSFYYFLKDQNAYSYKFMSLKKQGFGLWRQKRPKEVWSHSQTAWNQTFHSEHPRKLWMCFCSNQIFQPEL